MKKTLIIVAGLMISIVSYSQLYIRGSIQQGSAVNKADVVLQSVYTSAPGEYVNFLQFGIAIPATGNSGLVPVLTPLGNFVGLTFQAQTPYDLGSERIYNWICINLNTVTTMSWTLNTPFPAATLTFTGGNAPAKVRLVDFTNQGGDGNTFFAIATTNGANDPTDYGTFFFSQVDPNGSTLGAYPSADRFVETNLLISLPVSLLNFSGYKSGSKNVLKWNTANEVNNQGFEVQRSSDGVSYSPIGFVNSNAPSGNSSTELSYIFDDNSPVASKRNYYRLNQQDMDGRSKMSNVVMISSDKPTSIAIGGIFPNPATTQINVIIDAPRREDVTLVVMDVLGKTLKQKVVNVETGSNTVPVEIGGLAQGSYMVKVVSRSDGETTVSKFVKQQ
ncbi:MAG TPA: T9SS type A sorting domain-containing protein [Chitinophagaceae bacterium]